MPSTFTGKLISEIQKNIKTMESFLGTVCTTSEDLDGQSHCLYSRGNYCSFESFLLWLWSQRIGLCHLLIIDSFDVFVSACNKERSLPLLASGIRACKAQYYSVWFTVRRTLDANSEWTSSWFIIMPLKSHFLLLWGKRQFKLYG